MTENTSIERQSETGSRPKQILRGTVLRGLLAGGLFALVMAVPVWATLSSGMPPDRAILSWMTPFAVGAGLWPVHARMARLVLWSAAYVTALVFLLSGVVMAGIVLWPNDVQTFAAAGGLIDGSIGLGLYWIAVFMSLPMIGIEAKRLGFSWHW